MRDDIAIVQILKALHGMADDLDDNSFDNTIIQFFETPHDSATLTAFLQTYVNGAAIPTNPNETITLMSQMADIVNDPSTIVWDGTYTPWIAFWNLTFNDLTTGNTWTNLNNSNTQAVWYWGYGGVWH